MKTKACGLTDIGRRRENNQDQLLVNDALGLYAVADGMGGHAAGEVASQIAIEALNDAMSADSWQPAGAGVEEIFDRLARAFKEGNKRICDAVINRGEWRGMGTTIVALVASGDKVLIGHVGDSRAYLLREGRLVRLTDDHSWVSEQVRLGLLTDEEAHKHPMRNIITRALGNRDELEVDVTEESFRPGDLYLLCSDGLTSMLTDEEIRQILCAQIKEPEKACKMLVEQANENGGDDNTTVVVLAALDAN